MFLSLSPHLVMFLVTTPHVRMEVFQWIILPPPILIFCINTLLFLILGGVICTAVIGVMYVRSVRLPLTAALLIRVGGLWAGWVCTGLLLFWWAHDYFGDEAFAQGRGASLAMAALVGVGLGWLAYEMIQRQDEGTPPVEEE